MGTIRFALKPDKADKKGLVPVDLIYQLHGQRKFFRTDKKIVPANWNALNQEAIFLDKVAAKKTEAPVPDYAFFLKSKEVTDLNLSLGNLRKDIAKIEDRFEDDGIPYSSQMVIDRLKELKGTATKKELPSDVVLDFIEKYIRDHSATRVKGSLSVYKSLKAHLTAMVKKYKIAVTFQNIDHRFLQDFQNFLIEHRGLANTTVAKQISTLKTFLNYARKEGHQVSDRHRDFKIKKETLEVIALTQDEFDSLMKLDLSENKKYDQVRDVFAFAAASGLRYSDLFQLKREHIYKDEIRITVKKTKEPLSVPLNAISYSILKKYSKGIKPLPVISNQKMNAYLKGWTEKHTDGKETSHMGICEMARISTPTQIVRFRGAVREEHTYPKFELIGVHTARKTFVTLSLEKGMSAQEIMKITGHTDYKSFQRYEHITSERKKAVMVKAWGEIPKTKLKAV
ncbi:MAG TPA: site-specific integrase [Chitinophagaceae bacterium]|jgi:integrase|nr:site-specific integrase [Chitinophagaceae bacterium]